MRKISDVKTEQQNTNVNDQIDVHMIFKDPTLRSTKKKNLNSELKVKI